MLCPVCRKEFLDGSCGFLVYMNSECPLCLEVTTPLVALPCGHAVCKTDFEAIGGTLKGDSCDGEPQMLKSCDVEEETVEIEERSQSMQQNQLQQNNRSQPRQSRIVSPPSVSGNNRRDRNAIEPVRENHPAPSSAWILCSSNDRRSILRTDKCELWHVTGVTRERITQRYHERRMYQYPKSATYAGDGRGGLWILCDTLLSNAVGSTWRLWHVNGTRSGERDMYAFPKGSQLASDGNGGVWVLCTTIIRDGGRRQKWQRLWHVNERRERDLRFKYPTDSKMYGDGHRGVWVHCRASDGSWWLWHSNRQRELRMFQYPQNSKFAADGTGGVWALCPKGHNHSRSNWRLWYGSSNGWERDLYVFPAKSKLVGDGRGGVWLLSPRNGQPEQNMFRLWHVTEHHEICLPHYFHATSQLVGDGCGNLWILGPSDGSRWLFHINKRRVKKMFRYPKDALLIAPV